MTPEKMTVTEHLQHYFDYRVRNGERPVAISNAIYELKKLQAEKDRADRAEEIVAALISSREKLIEGLENLKFVEPSTNIQHLGNRYIDGILDREKSLYSEDEIKPETLAQAYNKRICDEIVGKLSSIALTHKVAIDIVKSVLGGEE